MTSRVRATAKKIQSDLLQDLANMADSDFQKFKEKWSRLFNYSRETLLRRRDELRWLWQIEAGVGLIPDFPEDVNDNAVQSGHGKPMRLIARTKKLRDKIWRQLRGPVDFAGICNHWLRLERQTFQVVTTKQGVDRITPNDHCLPAVLTVACVRFRELMKVCGTCQTYFIATRRDAKFCSAKCAKPAKREAKLRWWHRNRDRGRRPPS